MTERTGPRCPAVMLLDARPLLSAVAIARLAGKPIPLTDWRCIREPHDSPDVAAPTGPLVASGGWCAPSEIVRDIVRYDSVVHVAMPLGHTGPTCRFDPNSTEPGPEAAHDYAEQYAAYTDTLGAYHELMTRRGQLIMQGVDPADLATPARPLPPHQG